jgi:hypothetical protein
MSDQLKLRGALGNIEKRRRVGSAMFNEFHEPDPVEFKAERRILPKPDWSDGFTTLLEIRVGASYTTFRGDNDIVHEKAEKNAMTALCRCLYQDVCDDLIVVMKAVGDGKRHLAMNLLNDLFSRLNGRDTGE